MGVVELLPWDSDWLGFSVARLVVRLSDVATDVPAAVAQCQTAGIRLLYLVLDPIDAMASAAAQAVGAELFDTKLTYQLSLFTLVPPVQEPIGIQLTREVALTPALEQLAWQSGKYSRFRLDARIGSRAFEVLYTRWLSQSLVHGTVWTASNENNEKRGLLAFGTRGGAASIELLAVTPAARRQGIGYFMVQAVREAAIRQGHATLRVVTQDANQSARQFYEQCGFQLINTAHYYHLWL